MKKPYIFARRLSLWIRLTRKWNSLYHSLKENSSLKKIEKLNSLSLTLGIKRKIALASMAGFMTLGAQAQIEFERSGLGSETQTFPSLGIIAHSTPIFVDLDNDGDQDLVVGDDYEQIKYYINEDNLFTEQLGEDNPFRDIRNTDLAPAFIDADEDGDLDLVVGTSRSGLLYYSNENLVFTLESGDNSPFETISENLNFTYPTFGDVDADGDIDLIVGERYGTIKYFTNDNNIFTEEVGDNNPFSEVSSFLPQPVLVDFNADGNLDLVLPSQSEIEYFENNGDNAFTERLDNENPFNDINSLVNARSSEKALGFIDIDTDGDLDLYVGSSEGNLEYLQNNDGVFVTEVAPSNLDIDLIDVGFNSSPFFADVNNDGEDDLVIGNRQGTFNVYDRANGLAELTGENNPLDNIDIGIQAVPAFTDLDTDGDQDLIIGNNSGELSYYINEAGIFTEQVDGDNPFSDITVSERSMPFFADIDEDGDQDLILGEYYGEVRYYTNDDNVFTEQTGANNPFDSFGSDLDLTSVSLVDLDEDGDQDLLLGEAYGDILYYTNIDGVFTLQTDDNNPFSGLATTGSQSTPSFTDIDDDGDLDLFMGSNSGKIFEFRNVDNDLTGLLDFNSSKETSLNIYPNPATSTINTEEGNLEIVDALGNLILNTESTGKVDISSLDSGIYIVTQNGKRTTLIVE